MINHLCREKLGNMNANKKVKTAAAAIAVALCCEKDNQKRRKKMGNAVLTAQKHSWILFPATQRAALRRS